MARFSTALVLCFLATAALAQDYTAVNAIFSKYCLDCHSAKDPEANLVLIDFPSLMKGGQNGPAIAPNDSSISLLVRMVEGSYIKEGKNYIMPPGRKRKKLDPAEVTTIKKWVDAGAHGPAPGKTVIAELNVPKIPATGKMLHPIEALIDIPQARLIALASQSTIELRSSETGELKQTLSGHHGSINALALSADGRQLFSAGGEAARFGEIKEWNIADGKLLMSIVGHHDAIYALALSPDGKILASGSYDQAIKLWDVGTGTEIKTLRGHNGAVFGLAFRPDGKILASASADHTVKLWDVATGKRRDTLSQPLKDQYAVVFSPDGKRLMAGGADNRIRIWQISETAAETTNPLLDSRFAHDGAILRLAFSPDGQMLLSSADDRTVRLWDAREMTERLLLEKQPDWAAGLGFVRGGQAIGIGRLDGTFDIYSLDGHPSGLLSSKIAVEPEAKIAKPVLARLEPPGLQRGTTQRFKIAGTNLNALTNVVLSDARLSARLEGGANSAQAWMTIAAGADLQPGDFEISVVNAAGESGKLKLNVGLYPHVLVSQEAAKSILSLPITCEGTIDAAGRMDEIPFRVEAGQTIVFDLNAQSIGSKLKASLTLLDASGLTVASQGEFDKGDPLLSWTFQNSGVYRIRIADETANGSPDHFYSLTMGPYPMVTAVFPPGVTTNTQAVIQLTGYNLAGMNTIGIKSKKAGEMEVPLDPEKYRARKRFKVLVTDEAEWVETGANHSPGAAMPIPIPCAINGRITTAGTADLFRFSAKSGDELIIETEAAQRGSPMDTKLDLLYADGSPVERLKLQAVRDSAITFRPIDSRQQEFRLENWMEMELNQYLYLQGEVCRIFRMPRGPDSGFLFYSSGGARRDYFDTSGTAHALDEPCYIVEPHAPAEKLIPNGLPVFPIYYANDDDAERQLGTDSRVYFTAPTNADYLVRVTDNRGFGGERFCYRLMVRKPKPDFEVTLNDKAPAPSAGAGREFLLTAKRLDGFDGEIKVDISNVPGGFRITSPLVIQAGHDEATGTVSCDTNSVTPAVEAVKSIKITARAWLNGLEVMKSVTGFDKITVGEPAKLYVALEPYNEQATNFVLRPVAGKLLEMTVAPGGTVPAWIKVERHGHDDLVTFNAGNLPHGVIIDNIGLNGVLIPKDEDHREIFLQAARWVPDTDCLFYVRAEEAGNPASLPVMLHVRNPASGEKGTAMK